MSFGPNVFVEDAPVRRVRAVKALGIQIDQHLTWEDHTDYISRKISAGISALKRIKEYTNQDTVKSVYYVLVQPHFDYCCEVWDSINTTLSNRLQKLHNRNARIITNCKNEHGQSSLTLGLLGWAQTTARLMYKVLHNMAPIRLNKIFNMSNTIHHYIVYEGQIKIFSFLVRKRNILKKVLV